MSDIIEELLESFCSSSQKLEELSEGFEALQNSQKLVEQLSSNLGEAAHALHDTATSHGEFIKSAQATNGQLGEIIKVLKDLDTKSINALLSDILNGIKENKGKLTNVSTALNEAEKKAGAADAKLDQTSKQLEAVVAANACLAKQLADTQKAITNRADEATASAGERHKVIMFFLLISVAASGALVANLFNLLPI